jgi:hypothetical protein
MKWKEMGTSKRTLDPKFLSKCDDMSPSDIEARAGNRRRRMLCEFCGRPMKVHGIDAKKVTLACKTCNNVCVELKGSSAYRVATTRLP